MRGLILGLLPNQLCVCIDIFESTIRALSEHVLVLDCTMLGWLVGSVRVPVVLVTKTKAVRVGERGYSNYTTRILYGSIHTSCSYQTPHLPR